jgi:hypothetical protein
MSVAHGLVTITLGGKWGREHAQARELLAREEGFISLKRNGASLTIVLVPYSPAESAYKRWILGPNADHWTEAGEAAPQRRKRIWGRRKRPATVR